MQYKPNNVTYLTYEYVTSLPNSGGEGRTQPNSFQESSILIEYY